MEIRKYCCCVFVINCVIFLSVLGKTVSLNDLLAAEERSILTHRPKSKTSGQTTNVRHFPKDEKLTSSILTKHTTGTIFPSNKKLSPLTYKKTFQIRAPLRPKKLRYINKPRNRRISATSKREIDNYEKYHKNYIPLLKSIGVLFDNILGSDSREDDDMVQYYERSLPTSRSEECPCAHKSKYKFREPEQAKTSTTSASPITTKIPSKIKTIDLTEASSTSTHLTLDAYNGTFRRNKNLSVLSPRNTTSRQRNYNGFRERSLTAHYRNLERHIAGNNGSDENNNSRGGETEPYSENNQGNTSSAGGDNASCVGSCGTIGGDRNNNTETEDETFTTEADADRTDETSSSDRGDSNQLKGFDKLENRSNETESGRFLLQSSARLRGLESQEEASEILWKIEGSEENTDDTGTHIITSNQRVPERNGAVAEKDQEFRRTNKTLKVEVELPKNLLNSKHPNLGQDKQKIVMIYDGYSIARDVNGDNKLAEQGYRIHS